MRTVCSLWKILCVIHLLIISSDRFNNLRSQAQKLPREEVEVLIHVANKLKMDKWDFTVDPCGGTRGWVSIMSAGVFSNVTCNCSYNNSDICRITGIMLCGYNLTGMLPEEFADLPFLKLIYLTRNYLSGSIPLRWASMNLTELSISGNRISGTIPRELGNITTLKILYLEDNLLEGPLPFELGNLIKLERFFASGNNFTGVLPATFRRLRNLKYFLIDGNQFSGKIPDFIAEWEGLERLDMQGTSMEGPISSGISFLKNLTELRISDLKGPDMHFPQWQNMKNIKKLVLRNCSIVGEIPAYIGSNMKQLFSLDLSFNKFTGSIPGSIGDLSTLNFMYLTNNKLTGEIPAWILQSGAHLDISNNNFTGSLPQSCQQGNVNMAASFSSVGTSSGAPCLRNNLPCTGKAQYYSLFINCGGRKLRVDQHEYDDDLSEMGQSAFYSTERWAYSSTGDYIDSDADFIAKNTSVLNVSNPDLYMTARQSPISLRYYGFCLLNGNYTVSLHFAEIIFTDDRTFSSIGRRIFDVSIQGVNALKDFNIESHAGGPGKELIMNFSTMVTNNSLEIHLYWAGKGTKTLPVRGVYGPLISAITVTPNFKPQTGHHGLSVGAIVGIALASFVTISVVLILIGVKHTFHKHPADEDLGGLDLQAGYFTLKQIKGATNSFSNSNKIGEGGFGAVYKGILADGSLIAVKQLSAKSKQGNREFINEIGMILALQHPNLVKLFGWCAEKNQLLLIYEYMENNSLARALFCSSECSLTLNWRARCKICLGIARGLVYLHEESRLKVIHRDIKATNILLDRDFNAKISDFGLAKLYDLDNSHVTTRIAGTMGYMAPEYAMWGHLTEKADVYSFGVVVLEIVSGKSNASFKPEEEYTHLLDWAHVLREESRLLELVDPVLSSDYSEEEAFHLLNLALLCTETSAALRPKMSSVLSMLEENVESLASGTRGEEAICEVRDLNKLPLDDSQNQAQNTSMSMEGPSSNFSASLSG